MTRAFLAISRGRLGQASAANAGGLPLYAAMLGDQAAFAAAVLCRRRRRCRVPPPRGRKDESGETTC
jgi:hypothetical protein